MEQKRSIWLPRNEALQLSALCGALYSIVLCDGISSLGTAWFFMPRAFAVGTQVTIVEIVRRFEDRAFEFDDESRADRRAAPGIRLMLVLAFAKGWFVMRFTIALVLVGFSFFE